MRLEAAKAAWQPVDVEELEPAADDAVRGNGNTLVVAGPGAGKTELLAQRACFLLQTQACPDPRRILAISFKRDAARNLRERVVNRCGAELAHRFDSLTFDSFAKGLVDRFGAALPAAFRPAADYRVLDSTNFNERRVFDFVRELPSEGSVLSSRRREELNRKALWRAFVGRPIPADGQWSNRTDEEAAAAELWPYMLRGGGGSALAFPMIGLLADLLLRTNPTVLAMLRKSYKFVFLDEFQDTTGIHYALIRTAFAGSEAIVTAVGDNKQRIMLWAGAMENVFDRFCDDFEADLVRLKRNYRSAPRLVKIQSVVAQALDADAVEAVAMDDGAGGVGECAVLTFEDDGSEANHLADRIAGWIKNDGLSPRDICVLCRMKPPVYTERLREALAKRGVRARIEMLQELPAEPLAELLMDLLKLACRDTAPEAWGRTVALLGELAGGDSEVAMRRVVDGLLAYTSTLRLKLSGPSATEEQIEPILKNALRFVGEDRFKALHPQYLQGTWYDDVLKALVEALAEARGAHSWRETIDEIEGIDSVPIMTTHKSKGLEYHTILFVGLEDGAHFNFANNPNEETCGFFVALSRAMKRVVFTFGGARPTGKGGLYVVQEREQLEPLYALLEKAGIAISEVES